MIDEIICGDCNEVLKQFPDNFIDLTVTSPPYDNLREYNGYVFDFEWIAKELFRITKSGGVVVWVVGDATIDGSETGTSFRQALYFKEIGFKLHDTMIWGKLDPIPQTKVGCRYTSAFEYMFIFTKGRPAIFNPLVVPCMNAGLPANIGTQRKPDGTKSERRLNAQKDKIVNSTKQRHNIWWTSTGKSSDHPAVFPEQLASDHILSWSNPGDLILDPMCGSGTTCKMAKYHGRHFLGIDVSEEYCKIARKRVAAIPARLDRWSMPEAAP